MLTYKIIPKNNKNKYKLLTIKLFFNYLYDIRLKKDYKYYNYYEIVNNDILYESALNFYEIIM